MIKNPMDFGTIRKKLNNNIYEFPQQFVDDCNLVFSNCIYFNGQESFLGTIAVKLRECF